MKKQISILITAVLIFIGGIPAFAVEEGDDEGVQRLQKTEYREGEALIKISVSENKSRASLLAGLPAETETLMDLSKFDTAVQPLALRSGALSAQGASESGETVTGGKILLARSDTLSTEDLIEQLRQYPEVEYAEPNYMFRFASLTDDTYIDDQWYLQKGADAAAGSARTAVVWESNSTGDMAFNDIPVIAVIDSGIDYEHYDLKNMLWQGGKNCGVDFSDPEDSDGDGPMDHYGHGTHVAGIIGAAHNNGIGISGMSKSVKLMALKISDDSGNFDSASAVEAYNYMLEKKADGVNIIAANNSWGGYYYSRILEEVFDKAGENGIINVAAAGNESVDHDINLNSPEGGDRTMFLLVNASDEQGKAARFSDYGLVDTDIYAQGVNIFSTISGMTPDAAEEASPGYGYMDGTSVAAPVVTGAAALLYDYYDVDKKINEVPAEQRPALQRVALSEIRARIAGGVARTEEMKTRCASGGYLDLEKAVTNPYPVLDTLEQDGSKATITGFFFGTAGTLQMDGKAIAADSWSDRRIIFTIPDGTDEGLHEFRITDKSKAEYGTEQYGRDRLWVEEAAETMSGDFFEDLNLPDQDALGVAHPVEEQSYKMAAYNGKIFLTQDGMCLKGQEHPAILVYDEKSGEWSIINVSSLDLEGELQLIAGDDGLYLVKNRYTDDGRSRLQVFIKTDEDEFEKIGDSFQDDLSIYCSVAFDGRYIWMVGGGTPVYNDTISPRSEILRFDTETDQWEKSDISLKTARYNAVAEITDGKLIVTGGINRFGELERTTEIIDLKTGRITMGADLPEMEASQEISMAAGVYDGKLIISGMFDTIEHTADTYVYDLKANVWDALPQRLIDTKVFLMDGVVSREYFYVYGITLDGGNKKEVFRRLQVMNLPPEQEDESIDDEDFGEILDEEDPDNVVDEEEEQSGADGQGGGGSGKSGRFDTGDEIDIMLWLMLMTLTVAGAVSAALFGKRGRGE